MKKPIRIIRPNLDRHNVDEFEGEEALIDGWSHRTRDGENWLVLGRTSEGRYLELICFEDQAEIRLFHARDMTRKEKIRYGKKKNTP